MDDVHAEDKRNPEPGGIHRKLLELTDGGSSLDVEKTAYLAGLDPGCDVAALRVSGDDLTGDRKVQLPYLLF